MPKTKKAQSDKSQKPKTVAAGVDQGSRISNDQFEELDAIAARLEALADMVIRIDNEVCTSVWETIKPIEKDLRSITAAIARQPFSRRDSEKEGAHGQRYER